MLLVPQLGVHTQSWFILQITSFSILMRVILIGTICATGITHHFKSTLTYSLIQFELVPCFCEMLVKNVRQNNVYRQLRPWEHNNIL